MGSFFLIIISVGLGRRHSDTPSSRLDVVHEILPLGIDVERPPTGGRLRGQPAAGAASALYE